MICPMIAKAGRTGRAGTPWVTYALLGTCCVVFLLGPASGFTPGHGTGTGLLAARTACFARWGVVPERLWHGPAIAWFTPLTALFVHGNWLHLLGNMLFLHVFGAMTEQRLGRAAFALGYLITGYLALLGYAAAHAGSGQPLIGASGAISGVLGAFLRLFPRARVTSLFPFLFFVPLRFPAWVVLPFWFALQWTGAGGSTDRPQVAYLAHVIGFSLGFGLAWGCGAPAVRVRDAVRSTEGDNAP
ncbi:rhomboid family intramembrane serine protease [Streptomyces sp. NPDC052396]|uniref:rhomboid family intramembrane serine protease n=1 Tax=Streptomyces sp. NPDC052396 TaxID=3365689 RepID=UPI0037D66418